MKIITVLGARPQFIKAALVSRELRKEHQEIIIHTGQHYNRELSDIFFDEMNIPQLDYNLGIGFDTHARQTGQMNSFRRDQLLPSTEQISCFHWNMH